jgi:hypothetical protein
VELRELGVGVDRRFIGIGFEVAGDAGGMQQREYLAQGIEALCGRGFVHLGKCQSRGVGQKAGGITLGISLDTAHSRIWRVARDPGEFESARVQPARVSVGAPQKQRAIFFDLVQVMAIRLESRGIDRVDHDPGGSFVRRDAGANGVGGLFDLELLVVQGTAAERQGGLGRVDVGIDEAGQHGISGGVDYARGGTYPLGQALLVAHVNDLVAGDGDCASRWARRRPGCGRRRCGSRDLPWRVPASSRRRRGRG